MVYVFLATGFEETEAVAPIDILRRGGVSVKTVGVADVLVSGSHSITFKTDLLLSDLVLDDELEGVFLPGGMPGTLNLELSAGVTEAVKFAAAQGKLVSAICAAPSVVGKLGLLDGRKATCHPGFEQHLLGAEYLDVPTVTDGNFVTGRGPGSAQQFGLAVLAYLKGEEAANTVRDQLK
ncbi:thiazole biosynthesis protein ThiJ [Clostridia bacterium]|nr:thiazole biosynthesis protein ThiJ [Clostridia bacterium]